MAERKRIRSSDPIMLAKAIQTAQQFAESIPKQDVGGIVFLGSIVQGYFDRHADIDVAVFTRGFGGGVSVPNVQHVNGFEVHAHITLLADEQKNEWDMGKRYR